jgi:hypothetical protein
MAKSFICGCKRYASFSDVAQLGEGNSSCSFRPDPLTNMAATGNACF